MTAVFDPQPLILEGKHVRLEPLDIRHTLDLYHVGREKDLWAFLAREKFASPEDTEAWIREALQTARSGLEIPFAIICKESGRAIGSTRYLDISHSLKALEIGWTWLGKDYRRTAINTECKYLLLGNAFEQWGASRVCFKTDGDNLRSQKAIERIGAIREGLRRKHRIRWDGSIRDSAYFSIIEAEWTEVKKRLQAMMKRWPSSESICR